MIRFLVSMLFLFIITSIGLSIYLQPDDISRCGEKPSQSVGCQKLGAIVAVSGGDTDARTNEAINLYKNGWADRLIFSGAALDKTGPSNAMVMKNMAIKAGVPDSAIFIDEFSENTRQNAENVQKILVKNDIKSIILVTSGYHQRRASLEFTKSAKNVVVLNHPAKVSSEWTTLWWSVPASWFLAGSEVTKIIAFYIMGIFG